MGGAAGGGGGKGGGGGGQGGASDFDLALIGQAVGQNIQALQNRYHQLGIGQPSGDPLTAAMGGQSLTYAGPSTMEQQDVQGQHDLFQAAVGQVQEGNINNPFAPGSPANLAELAAQQQQFASASGTLAGSQAAGGGGTSSTVAGGTQLGGPTGGTLDAGTPPGTFAPNVAGGQTGTRIG